MKYLALILALTLMAFKAHAESVDAYWLWSGVSETAVPAKADTPLFLYQGLIRSGKDGRYLHKGLYPSHLSHRHVFLVYRVEPGASPEKVIAVAAIARRHWADHDVRIEGLQIDSDWPTAKLDLYGAYLARLRAMLPKDQKLSVTGMGDWAAHGQMSALKTITQAGGPITFQLYRQRDPLPFADSFVTKIKKLNIDFRLGLLPGQQNLIVDASRSPYYRGTTYFLQKDTP